VETFGTSSAGTGLHFGLLFDGLSPHVIYVSNPVYSGIHIIYI
jgi:hypothetical protein